MYCPKCGQSQVSAEVRFCSRCGFPLVGVADLLLTGGTLPAHSQGDAGNASKGMSPRRAGVRQGGAALLFSVFLIPFFVIMHEIIGLPQEFALLGVIGVIGSFLRIIYAAFFEDGRPRDPRFAPQPPHLYTPPQPLAPHLNAAAQEMLPPAHQQGAPPAYRQPPVDTAQIRHPPSVTDHTTRLLEKQSDPSER
jgi:hypothetical protein